MKQLKISISNKQMIARIIKNELRGKEYFECFIICDVDGNYVNICPTFMMELKAQQGYIKYKYFNHYAVDGNITIKQIIEEIFG